MDIRVRDSSSADPSAIAAALLQADAEHRAQNLLRHLEDVAAGKREAVTALLRSQIVGYGTLNWSSKHATFRDASVPEIQDLFVVPAARRSGVGSAILQELERRAALRSAIVGVGVGLYRAYGSAQRLYAKRGYVPDGSGVWAGDREAMPGTQVRLDDQLVLYLTKTLRAGYSFPF
jgi:GNAT superfamily N-acetyltransferase